MKKDNVYIFNSKGVKLSAADDEVQGLTQRLHELNLERDRNMRQISVARHKLLQLQKVRNPLIGKKAYRTLKSGKTEVVRLLDVMDINGKSFTGVLLKQDGSESSAKRKYRDCVYFNKWSSWKLVEEVNAKSA